MVRIVGSCKRCGQPVFWEKSNERVWPENGRFDERRGDHCIYCETSAERASRDHLVNTPVHLFVKDLLLNDVGCPEEMTERGQIAALEFMVAKCP